MTRSDHQSSFNIIHNSSIIKIDFIIRKKQDYRIVEFRRRQKRTIFGQQINIVSKEDLIISKLIWAKESESEMQKKDVINLLNQDFDRDYLEKWLKEIDLINFFKEFIGAGYIT
ncbi:MAG: hypothetical protein K9N40_12375 [Candidatus Cloacimonetes bacterium]|nr:hypothetical protein [Candidatus Cloacimonadota bacterium]